MHDKKALDEGEWNWQCKGVANCKGFPGFEGWRKAAQQYFEPGFIKFVDDVKAGTPVWWNDRIKEFVAAPYDSGPPDGGT